MKRCRRKIVGTVKRSVQRMMIAGNKKCSICVSTSPSLLSNIVWSENAVRRGIYRWCYMWRCSAECRNVRARVGFISRAACIARNGSTTTQSLSFRSTTQVSYNEHRYAIQDAVLRARIEARTPVFSLGRVLGNHLYAKITDSYIPRPVSVPNIALPFEIPGFSRA